MAKYNHMDKLPLSRYRRIMADKYSRMEVVPWWKAPVSYDFARNELRVAPLVFHLIFRWLVNAWLLFRIFGLDTQRYYYDQLEARKQKQRRDDYGKY